MVIIFNFKKRRLHKWSHTEYIFVTWFAHHCFLRLLLVYVCSRHLFIFIAVWYSKACLYHNLKESFCHWTFGSSQFGPVMNSVAVNYWCTYCKSNSQMYSWQWDFWGICSPWAVRNNAPFLHSHQRVVRVPIALSLAGTWCCQDWVFASSDSVMVAPGGCNSHLPDT